MAAQQAAAGEQAESSATWKKRVLNYLVYPIVAAAVIVGLGVLAWLAPWKQTAFTEVGTWGTAIRCGTSSTFVHGTFNTVNDIPVLILLDDCSDRHPAGTIIDLRTRQIIPPSAPPNG